MKLSWKIYITFFIFFVVIAFLTSYIIVVKRISDAEKWIVEENKALGNFLSNEIEVGYLKLNWPFESLRRLSEYKSFLFWWVIKDDGTIYLSDNTSFMGTYAYDYFPQVANMIEDENVVLNRSQNYGIFIKPLETGGKKWSFWFGFSLKEASEIRKEIIFMILTGSMSALIVLGFIFYFTIKHFTKPINNLIIGTEIIGKGDLTHRVKIESRDELGQLAYSFNRMAEELQKTTVSKDYVDNIIRNMVDSLIVVDLDGKIRTINKAAKELLGYNEKELIGQPIGTVIAEESSPFNSPRVDELIINSSSLNVERTYVSKDGRKIPVLFSGSVMFDNDGKAQGIVCVAQDITKQKQALEALKESEEKYRLVFENAKEGICIYEDFPDGNRKLVDCNSRYVEMSGYSRKELMQISDTLKIQQDHRTPNQEATGVDKAWAGQPYSGVFSWHRPDGKENYIEYTAVSLDIDDRRFTIGIDHDITERKQAEESLARERNLLRTLIDNVPDQIYVKDTESRFVIANTSFIRLVGAKTPEEVIGKTDFDFFPQNAPAYYAYEQEIIRSGQPVINKEESDIDSGDGMGWVLTTKVPLQDSDGKIIGLVGINRDITERKQAEIALRESESRLKLILDSMQAGILIVDAETHIIVDANSVAVTLIDAPKEQIIGLICHKYICPAEKGKCPITDFGQTIDNSERVLLTASGERRSIIKTVVTENLKGRKHLIESFVDITDLKRAEDELKKIAEKLTRSNTELEQFAYVASHDLQEPLRMVASYVQLLARRYKGRLDAEADDFIEYAVDGANRMQRLINDLLAYSRVSTRGRDFKPTNCETVFDQVLDNLQMAVEESNAIVTHDPLPTVMADDVQLVQLFQNLISNAIKFHGEQPSRVHVSTEQKENEWIFSVRDNGIGIEPEYFDRIFIIFQRLHSKREYSGTGIGLSICKKIVERHGGGIWVESQFGKGATFYFTIPMRGDE